MRHLGLIGAVTILATTAAGAASASVMVVGGGLGRACYLAAKTLERTGAASPADLSVCNQALDTEALSPRDHAATLVNRGIMLMSRHDYGRARDDYARAVRLRPNLGEAHVNLGAALIGLNQPSEGIAAIDQGLALNSKEPEKAYYNRALARERLGDVKGAYLDFKRASELAPAWLAPQREMQRFTVTRRQDG